MNKNSSSIIAVGCSNTYGYGLYDIAVDHSGTPNLDLGPSKLAWPSLLSEKLNLNFNNLSLPGVSCKWMAQQIINREVSKNDIVIFLWTFPGRTCFKNDQGKYCHFVNTENEYIRFSNHITQDLVLDSSEYLKMQAKYGSSSDMIEESMVWISAANRSLESRTKKVFNFSYSNIYDEYTLKYNVNMLYNFGFIIESHPKVLRNHPGEYSHTLIANKIYDFVLGVC